MRLSQSESMLALVTLAVVLYGGGFLFASPRIDQWKKWRFQQNSIIQKIEMEKALLQEKGKWDRELSDLKKVLPVMKKSESVDVFWKQKIFSIQQKRNVNIEIRGKPVESKAGDFYEMRLDCSNLQGSLENMIGFLFDLQADVFLIDVRDIILKPQPDGKLSATSMNVYCAYRKE